MTTTMAITPWYSRPTPMPFDFIGTATFVEKLQIFQKEQGYSLPIGCGPYGGGGGHVTAAYFIFVMTPFGDMRIEVSEKVFGLLNVGDNIVVSYRRGRWTAALKGTIAR